MDQEAWIYDLRTNKEFTLKQRRMARADLDEFVACYSPANRNQRKPLWDEKKNPEGRWRVFSYEELIARDKCSLDIFLAEGRIAGGLGEPAGAARACGRDRRGSTLGARAG
jgi:hypothetical protein